MKNLQLDTGQLTHGRYNNTLHGEAGQGGSGNDGLYGGDDKDSLLGQVANEAEWRVVA